MDSGTTSSCYNTAYIKGEKALSDGLTRVGGIVGHMLSNQEGNYIKDCYNRGNIYGVAENVGGIIGSNGGASKKSLTIENCYSTGNLTGKSRIGIIIGVANDVSLKNCYKLDSSSSIPWQGDIYIKCTKTNCNSLSDNDLKACPSGLGTGFKKDDKNINSGFPILTWQ